MKILLLLVAIVILLPAGQNLNGIYLGEDVSSSTPQAVAVQIREDGTVIAFKDRVVPMMHDKYGREVRIRKVELR